MKKKSYPWCGTGATLDITGARFSLAVMSDSFIPVILGAVEKTDTSKIFTKTDALSTVYRGKRAHVLNCLRACFANANDNKTHITMEALISKGCPGDSDGDSFLAADDLLQNERGENFPVLSKIAFYPLGVSDYIDHIAHVVRLAQSAGVYAESSHYATVLEGGVNDIFDFLEKAVIYAENNLSHYALCVTLSANSPTVNNSRQGKEENS